MFKHIRYRDVREEDKEYLISLYRSTRDDIVLHGGHMSDKEKDDFVRMQFELQDIHYKKYYPMASYQIIQVKKKDVGRLYIAEYESTIEILDIAFDTKHRSKGYGHEVMSSIISRAKDESKKVLIYVAKNNRAINLYNRLGFKITGDESVYHKMTLETKMSEKKESIHV